MGAHRQGGRHEIPRPHHQTPRRILPLANKADLIINNRVGKGRRGNQGGKWDPAIHSGDYGTPEQNIGQYSEVPWETCMTICHQWAWKPDDKMKSAKQCIQSLIQTTGGNGNFLFNVGPMPDGRIEPRQVARLKEMGAWMKLYGESIHGTRGGPVLPSKNLLSTRKGNTIYLHLLNNNGSANIPIPTPWIKQSKVITGGSVTLTPDGPQTTTLTLGKDALKDIDAIIAITLDRSAMDIKTR